MMILSFLFQLLLSPTEVVALHYAGCKIVTRDTDGVTVVKWVCPRSSVG